MAVMVNKDELQKELVKDLRSAKLLSDLEKLQIKYLGRKGLVNSLLQSINILKSGEKKALGKKVNDLKVSIKRLIETKKKGFVETSEGISDIDVTLPGKKYPKGSLHLVTYAIEEISKIFQKIGFNRMTYPEVEWEYFSFDSLNMPKGHPARDDFETFFIDVPEHPKYGKMILSPHTSSGQVREMLRAKKPPIRMINIAKCYRPNWDTSHTPMFHQFEGLCIDKDINITHLKGTIDYFAKDFFGENRKTRLRPFHFQFTEPSFEVDISCGVCNGTGFIKPNNSAVISNEVRDPKEISRLARNDNNIKCRVCKSGWLELGGAGMVHPSVLKAGGIDPNKYTGWAFGIGPERCIMMKEGIKLDDLRILYDNDIRFLEQF